MKHTCKHLSEYIFLRSVWGSVESAASPSWLTSFLKWLKLLIVHSSSVVVVYSGEASWEPSYEKSSRVVSVFLLPKIAGVSTLLRPVFMLTSQLVVLTLHRKYKLRPHVNVQLRTVILIPWADFQILSKILYPHHCFLVPPWRWGLLIPELEYGVCQSVWHYGGGMVVCLVPNTKRNSTTPAFRPQVLSLLSLLWVTAGSASTYCSGRIPLLWTLAWCTCFCCGGCYILCNIPLCVMLVGRGRQELDHIFPQLSPPHCWKCFWDN